MDQSLYWFASGITLVRRQAHRKALPVRWIRYPQRVLNRLKFNQLVNRFTVKNPVEREG